VAAAAAAAQPSAAQPGQLALLLLDWLMLLVAQVLAPGGASHWRLDVPLCGMHVLRPVAMRVCG
jgi:hypothetical protein